MTKEELLAYPEREMDEVLHNVTGVWVIPAQQQHESGWGCMSFLATFKDKGKKPVRFGGGCDDVMFEGDKFRMDCDYPSGIIHIWSNKPFSITSDVSSISFIDEEIYRRSTGGINEDITALPWLW